ncbi:MAG: hypothetical protein RIT27_450 [Pseudomonadota bacterium]|jgi:ATP-binding cassette subfamily C protein LapB
MDTLKTTDLCNIFVALARFYNKPLSAGVLCREVIGEELTPNKFKEIAHNAGFSSAFVKRTISNFQPFELPAILILNNQQSVLLLKYNDTTCQILTADHPDTPQTISTHDLNYSGHSFLVRPRRWFDLRSADFFTPRAHWYWQTIWQAWALYGEVVLASLIINVLGLAIPLFVMNVYDRVVPNQALETLWVFAIGIGIVLIFDGILRGLRGYFIDIAGKRADRQLSRRVLSHLLHTPLANQPPSIGSFASHLHEFESFRDFFTSAVLSTLIDIPFSALFIIVIFILGGQLAIIPLFAMLPVLLFSILLQFPLQKNIGETLRASTQKQAMLIETLNGLETIKTLASEQSILQRWAGLIDHAAKYSLRSKSWSAMNVHVALFVQQFSYVSMVVFGVYLITNGALTVGGLIACTILNGRALAPLTQIAGLLMRYQQSKTAFQALNKVMAQPQEHSIEQSTLETPILTGELTFKQLHFIYPNAPQPSLKEINLHIKSGEKVGIIGRTGSGKSTLAKLLLNLYQPSEGNVLVDGLDVRQFDPITIRQQLGYVPQEITLFYGTIRDNLIMGSPLVTDQQLLQAIRIAGIEEWLQRYPLGLEMPIGENGRGLSGGQRQSIALARSLINNPNILLFDEPTNGLDNQAEEQFKQRLQPYLVTKTLLLITHRASLLNLVDRLIVLDNGKIIADGARDVILQALSNGQIKTHA